MRTTIFAAAIFLSGFAHAHETTGPNGGRVVDAGNLHVELVASGKSVNVFVTDANDKPVPAADFKGTAILVVDGKALRVPLAPAKDNRLTGAAQVEIPDAAKGAVQLQLPGGGTVQGRFQ